MPGRSQKHVPLRNCIACHQRHSKRELIRVVRTPDGAITVDVSGKLAGRGAYLCRRAECWQVALDRVRLGRALKCRVSADDMACVQEAFDELLAQSVLGLDTE